MLQEDSNGDTGFEFVEKKTDELSVSGETAGSLSSMSSSPSLISSPGTSSGVNVINPVVGNLLSNIPPPSELPSFLTSTMPTVLQPQVAPPGGQTFVNIDGSEDKKEHFYPTTFSPAIPPSKGIPMGAQPMQATEAIELFPQTTVPGSGGGIFGWVKGAVSSGGILSKVAEKAKNSVDSMITTLDPQMREFIYSGGDVDILVASDKEIKISPIREAFQAVFGKATISGISAQPTNVATQPVGWTSGIQAAEERIASVYTTPQMQPLPVVAIESFLVEMGGERWYDLAVLILSDPGKHIHLQTFTQMTPIPTAVISVLRDDTPQDYPLRNTGFAVTIGSVMARNLQVESSNWHQALTGVSRRDIILSAAKQLAGLYKNSLNEN